MTNDDIKKISIKDVTSLEEAKEIMRVLFKQNCDLKNGVRGAIRIMNGDRTQPLSRILSASKELRDALFFVGELKQ